jgi:NADH-quinone oxidoreductase subunit M
MLVALVLAPFVAALITGLIAGGDGRSAVRWSILGSLAIALLGFWGLGFGGAPQQWSVPWFRLWGTEAVVSWSFAADGLNIWLVHLVTALTAAGLAAASAWMGPRLREFALAVFLMEGAMIGALLAADLVVFYVFFEAMLLPMLFLVVAYGDQDRRGAALQFFLMTMLGSVFLLVSAWYLARVAGTTDLALLPQRIDERLAGEDAVRGWLFWGFLIAFAVKTPLLPLHIWQARVYAAAPAVGTALLAGAMAKLGPYGLMRLVVPLFPAEALQWAPLLQGLALAGVVIGALIAIRQDDLKRIVAWSSLSHLSLVVLAIFAIGPGGPTVWSGVATAWSGVMLQLVAHGFSVGALFLVLGMLEQRRGRRGINDFGGLGASRPGTATLVIASLLIAVAVPPTAGFVGEFLMLAGLAQAHGLLLVAVAGTTLVLTAVYLLRIGARVVFGPVVDGSGVPAFAAPRPAEVVPVVLLLAGSLALGLWPRPVQSAAVAPINAVIERVRAAAPSVAAAPAADQEGAVHVR